MPKEIDRHMIKYVIGLRKNAIEANPDLLRTERWDHSDVFYAVRTYLNQLGWDTSVYNDNTFGGKDRRKALYDMIKPVCEGYHNVKRHQIGIYPDDRAVMSFGGRYHTVTFDSLGHLMQLGTDIVFVEKQGTVIKMVPFTEKMGIAFIDSQGFGSEYGTVLARLCDKQRGLSAAYTNGYLPTYRGHLGTLRDCDASGVAIGLKVYGATNLGLDLNTIQEINEANPGLALEIEELQETVDNNENTHFKGLIGILNRKGKLYESLSEEQGVYCHRYLSEYHYVGNEQIQFIDWLENNRIELNTVLAVAKPTAVWNWLENKLLQVWPKRDYRRAAFLTESLRSPTMGKFIEWYDNLTKPIIKDTITRAEYELSDTEGFIEDVDARREEIETDIIDNTLLPHDKIKKIDLALDEIMKNDD